MIARAASYFLAISFLFLLSQPATAEEPEHECIGGRQHIDPFSGKNILYVTFFDSQRVWDPDMSQEENMKQPTQYIGWKFKRVFSDTLSKEFSDYPWVSVYSELPSQIIKDKHKNVLELSFHISLRNEIVDKNNLTVGNISLTFKHLNSRGGSTEIPSNHPLEYPFIVPNDDLGIENAIIKGVRTLTSWMPKFFFYLHEGTIRTHVCPEL